MDKKRCQNCKFWQYVGSQFGSPHCGDCVSEDANNSICLYSFTTKPTFGCIHWQEKEPDLRERLRRYMFDVLARTRLGNGVSAVEEAGMILAIVENYQKGESDV